jgi:hypothetical protein
VKRITLHSTAIPIISMLLDRLYRLDSSIVETQLHNAVNPAATVASGGAPLFTNFDKRYMCSEVTRRATFNEWPHMDYKWVLPDALAQAGFFYQPTHPNDDRTMCFCCDLCLVTWEQQDQPWSEHERHSPICHFVRGEITENIPLSVTAATLNANQCFSPPKNMNEINTSLRGEGSIRCTSELSSDRYFAVSDAHGHVIVYDMTKEIYKEIMHVQLINESPATRSKKLNIHSLCFYFRNHKTVLYGAFTIDEEVFIFSFNTFDVYKSYGQKPKQKASKSHKSTGTTTTNNNVIQGLSTINSSNKASLSNKSNNNSSKPPPPPPPPPTTQTETNSNQESAMFKPFKSENPKQLAQIFDKIAEIIEDTGEKIKNEEASSAIDTEISNIKAPLATVEKEINTPTTNNNEIGGGGEGEASFQLYMNDIMKWHYSTDAQLENTKQLLNQKQEDKTEVNLITNNPPTSTLTENSSNQTKIPTAPTTTLHGDKMFSFIDSTTTTTTTTNTTTIVPSNNSKQQANNISKVNNNNNNSIFNNLNLFNVSKNEHKSLNSCIPKYQGHNYTNKSMNNDGSIYPLNLSNFLTVRFEICPNNESTSKSKSKYKKCIKILSVNSKTLIPNSNGAGLITSDVEMKTVEFTEKCLSFRLACIDFSNETRTNFNVKLINLYEKFICALVNFDVLPPETNDVKHSFKLFRIKHEESGSSNVPNSTNQNTHLSQQLNCKEKSPATTEITSKT